MGGAEVRALLSHLAVLLFVDRELLERDGEVAGALLRSRSARREWLRGLANACYSALSYHQGG
jgi:hypothetical protein